MIEIFGFPEDKIVCPNCRNAVRLCELNGVEYKFYPVIHGIERGKIIRHKENVQEIMKRMDWSDSDPITVPQIFVDGVHIGELIDLKNYFKKFTNSSK